MKKNKKSINYGKWGYLFILPFFIIYLIFSLIPLVDTVRYSFFWNISVLELKKSDPILLEWQITSVC